MGFIFRRRVRVAKGIYVNLGKKGVNSVSLGGRGATVNFSGKGSKLTLNARGTGLSYTTNTYKKNNSSSKSKSSNQLTEKGALVYNILLNNPKQYMTAQEIKQYDYNDILNVSGIAGVATALIRKGLVVKYKSEGMKYTVYAAVGKQPQTQAAKPISSKKETYNDVKEYTKTNNKGCLPIFIAFIIFACIIGAIVDQEPIDIGLGDKIAEEGQITNEIIQDEINKETNQSNTDNHLDNDKYYNLKITETNLYMYDENYVKENYPSYNLAQKHYGYIIEYHLQITNNYKDEVTLYGNSFSCENENGYTYTLFEIKGETITIQSNETVNIVIMAPAQPYFKFNLAIKSYSWSGSTRRDYVKKEIMDKAYEEYLKFKEEQGF